MKGQLTCIRMSQRHLIVKIVELRKRRTECLLAPQLRIILNFRYAFELQDFPGLEKALSLQIEVHLKPLASQNIVVGRNAGVGCGMQFTQQGLKRKWNWKFNKFKYILKIK